MTKKDFIALEANKKSRNSVLTAAIIAYVSAGLTLILIVIGVLPVLSLLDVAIIVAAGVVVHVNKSFPAAIVLLSYGVLNMVIGLITMGKLQGWVIVLAGIFAVIETSKLNKAWKAYQQTGVLPVMPVQPGAQGMPQNMAGIPAAPQNMTPVVPVQAETVDFTMAEAPAAQPANSDLINRYRDLLDSGIITQEEYNAKVRELFG